MPDAPQSVKCYACGASVAISQTSYGPAGHHICEGCKRELSERNLNITLASGSTFGRLLRFNTSILRLFAVPVGTLMVASGTATFLLVAITTFTSDNVHILDEPAHDADLGTKLLALSLVAVFCTIQVAVGVGLRRRGRRQAR